MAGLRLRAGALIWPERRLSAEYMVVSSCSRMTGAVRAPSMCGGGYGPRATTTAWELRDGENSVRGFSDAGTGTSACRRVAAEPTFHRPRRELRARGEAELG